MARPTSKNELITASAHGYGKLMEFAASMTEDELAAPFDFSADKGRKEAHWSRDKNLRDVLSHLHEWHRLLLDWVGANEVGEKRPFLPEPYTWRTYGDMNVALWRKHQDTPPGRGPQPAGSVPQCGHGPGGGVLRRGPVRQGTIRLDGDHDARLLLRERHEFPLRLGAQEAPRPPKGMREARLAEGRGACRASARHKSLSGSPAPATHAPASP